jgi:RHS repeat-associated protein
MIVMCSIGGMHRTDQLLSLMGCESCFSGKERDAESGNDYFEARYYSSAMGRFMSPDWSAKEEPVPYAKLDDPQSLNLYAYVLNNPLAGVDADGHDGKCGGSGQQPCPPPPPPPPPPPTPAPNPPAPKPNPPAPTPTPNPIPPVAAYVPGLPNAANPAAQAAEAAAKNPGPPTPPPIPRPVPGPNPVPPGLKPGNIPAIEPGASNWQKFGVMILNIVKGFGQSVEVFPVVCIECRVQPSWHDRYCGKNNPDCSAELLQENWPIDSLPKRRIHA